jgi:hypothetical protein
MKYLFLCPITALVVLSASLPRVASGQNGLTEVKIPSAPVNLQVPAGNVAFLKANAAGTQNYVCLPSSSGPKWTFQGPQATLFVKFPWINGEGTWQVATHFPSSNPSEAGLARPTWQSSHDTSTVWGKAIASSTDPKYVVPGAIPWLLVEATGTQQGPMGGTALSQTTFIQRVNTSGGVAPSEGCDESVYGKLALVPYTTDYYFYQSSGPK